MKKILILALVAFLAFGILSYLPVHGEAEIYDSVVRLHVIANSDSEEDQALKLTVRDALLREMPKLLDGVTDRETAIDCLENSLDDLQRIAESTVRAAGYDYEVSVWLGEERYPSKAYEQTCFPVGTYESLQVKIGEADGKNWWCVLFPQLCLSSAKRAEEAFVEVGLTGEQYKIITETQDTRYKIRFKILEVIEEAFG